MMPMIELLAYLLGQVLVRAVGLIMAGMGKWYQMLGKLGTFIINKFADPVLDAMMTFFGSLVEGAANAFDWIPGIGGKLREASDSFDDWATTTVATVKAAGADIAKQAEVIGESMVEEGLEMARSGQARTSMYDAGFDLGANIGAGMQQGMKAEGAGVAYEARKMSMQAITSAKTTLDENSPSKVFIKIGGDVVEGACMLAARAA